VLRQPAGSVASVIDLHLHSVFSDGSETPERICELAAEGGLSGIALTDHDGTGGIERARVRAGELGLRLVPGCEVSCQTEQGSLHMLCYFNAVDDSFGAELDRLAADRSARNEQMAAKLMDLGLPITYEEVIEEAGGKGIGRPHFAAVLVRNGAAESIQDAFDKYLGRGASGYVNKARLAPTEAIELAVGSGAAGVLAHPLSLGLERPDLERLVAGLAEDGLFGLESYYGRYDPETRAELAALARRHGLTPTGGSDFHGSYKPDLAVGTGTGDLDVPDELLDELVARLGTPAARGV
jgi:3',5'-nucleoside bisphosphate phosphatase